MTYFDYAVFAVLALSFCVGLWRGVAGEILALAAWVAAFFAARAWGAWAGERFLSGWIMQEALRAAAGVALVVVAVLVLFAIARKLIAFLLRSVGLGPLDRLLGGVFGLARGLVIVLLAVLVGGMTSLPQQAWWRNATLAAPLETAALAIKPWLPAELAQRIHYAP